MVLRLQVQASDAGVTYVTVKPLSARSSASTPPM